MSLIVLRVWCLSLTPCATGSERILPRCAYSELSRRMLRRGRGRGLRPPAALASACPPPGSSLSSGEGVAPCLGGGPWGLPWGPPVLAHDLAHEDLCNVWLSVPLAHSCSTQRETSLPYLRPLLGPTSYSRSFSTGPLTSCSWSGWSGLWPLLGPLSDDVLLPAGGRHKGVGSHTPCSPRTRSCNGPSGRR